MEEKNEKKMKNGKKEDLWSSRCSNGIHLLFCIIHFVVKKKENPQTKRKEERKKEERPSSLTGQ